MQSLEKALHQPMPFTTGGQTISDRLTAAKHSIAGSQLAKTICKATTEELMAPKKKHCDYLLHCTNEPNVSIPSMANLLIERTQNPNWVVVYKSLITIHNIMCYGNERFSQYLASCSTSFNFSSLMDRGGALAAGYDMSTHVRRYGKYISEKIHTYRLCAFDFCKVKRGREDGLLRTMHTDKLLKTLPILQNQIDALLDFQVTSSELNNGVINCAFILLFRDLIRLFACYNDGVINLLEKFFEMNKKQCREALDMYKAFLFRLDKVSDFLRVAEAVGIDRGEIPDLTRAPASLLEALEAHLYQLEGGRGPPPTMAPNTQQMLSQQIYQQQESFNFAAAGGSGSGGGGGGGPYSAAAATAQIDEYAKQRYLEEEKERLRQFEEQRRQQLQQQQGGSGNGSNPFGSTAAPQPQLQNAGQPNPDLLSFFDTAPVGGGGGPASTGGSNPFAAFTAPPQPQQPQPQNPQMFNPFAAPVQQQPQPQSSNPFGGGVGVGGGVGGYGQQYPTTMGGGGGGMYGQPAPGPFGGGGYSGSFGQQQPPPQQQQQPPQQWNAFGPQQPFGGGGAGDGGMFGQHHQQGAPHTYNSNNTGGGGQQQGRDPFAF